MSELLAGFDAGQSHTRCRLAPAGGGPALAEGEGPGVCHLAAPEGPERFAAALRESLIRARAQLLDRRDSAGTAPLLAAVVGASGIEHGTPVQEQGLALAATTLGLPPTRLRVTGDERTGLRGAFPDGPGILVISGTGTITLGRDGQGREHRCAGWGWLLDGAGAAMDIGRDGLALSLRMADGRAPTTPLLAALWGDLGLDPADPLAPQRIKARVVEPSFGPAGFARLAPRLNALAAAGDPQAAAILQRHGEALAEAVAAVAAALALQAPPVCGQGGALTHLDGLHRAFRAALARRCPGAQLVPPAGDACAGALALAREL
ncbi:MAG: BadF/BadG/BcrA/BcrD ATPase family protein [Synechococcaceae cyanobacterium]|nr:BadF/BadG/BcrA/BcrD ATPase family protein [Synechococcaceae cyanobacterium]